MTQGPEAILERMGRSDPLSVEDLDLSINDGANLGRALGRTFTYFARVEAEVSAEPLMVLLPRLGTTYRGYTSYGTAFLELWVAQEHAHGQLFGALQAALGLEPPPQQVTVPVHNRIMGALGTLSPALHAVLEMVYLTRGAMHEKLTSIGYERMARGLLDLGERGLNETVIKPIRTQEATHLAYYCTEARRLRTHLKPWQLALARRISVLTYAPVGAGAPQDRADFGHVAIALAGDDIDQLAAPVGALAAKLLGAPERPLLPRFVTDALHRCVEAERTRAAVETPLSPIWLESLPTGDWAGGGLARSTAACAGALGGRRSKEPQGL